MKYTKEQLIELSHELRKSDKPERITLMLNFISSLKNTPLTIKSNANMHVYIRQVDENTSIDLWPTTIRGSFNIDGKNTTYTTAFEILNTLNDLYGE